MKKKIYLLDTNILLDWMACYHPDFSTGNESWKISSINWCGNFCDTCKDQIYVADLVWVEFLSVFLHKKILVEHSFQDTLNWFRKQETFVQQMEYAVLNKPNWDFLTLEVNPFQDAKELLIDPGFINQSLFDWMKNRAEKNQFKFGNYGPLIQKILDGMDSAILIYLSELAHMNSDHQVILLTGDLPLFKVLKHIKRYHNGWFAQNTDAMFSLYMRFD